MKLAELTINTLLDAGCYLLNTPKADKYFRLVAFNIREWNFYSEASEMALLLESPTGTTILGYRIREDMQADIAQLSSVIRRCKREFDAAHPQYEELPLF